MFANTPRGDDSLWLFSLDGRLGPVEPAGLESTAISPQATPAAGAANLDRGRAVFASACSACHGANGEGGHGGGPSLAAATSPSVVERVVSEGRDLMPVFARALSTDDIRDVVAYVTRGIQR